MTEFKDGDLFRFTEDNPNCGERFGKKNQIGIVVPGYYTSTWKGIAQVNFRFLRPGEFQRNDISQAVPITAIEKL